ncbi:hypothetical protein MBLNU230_g1987t1 [Neophaeotheca triangularis]
MHVGINSYLLSPSITGAGATLTTSGLLSSTTTPSLSKIPITPPNNPPPSLKLNCAPLSPSRLGVKISNPTSPNLASRHRAKDSNETSKNPVSATLFARNSAIEVRLKTSKLARKAVMSATLGFESWKPAAPGLGSKAFVMANLLLLLEPHQPARRGR